MGKRKTTATAAAADGKPPGPPIAGLMCAADGKDERIEWEWTGRIMANATNIIDGNKGVGKSTLLATMAATISEGKKFPGERKACVPGNVLWFSAEESFMAAVKPRFVAAGGDAAKLFRIDNAGLHYRDMMLLPEAEDLFISTVHHLQIRVVVCDPFTAILEHGLSQNDSQQMRAYLESMAIIADKCRCTFLLVRHFRKGSTATHTHLGMGSVAIGAVTRICLSADIDPRDESKRLLSTAATNFGSTPKPIAYTLEDGGGDIAVIKWGKVADLSLDEIREGIEDAGSKDERVDAVNLLKALLKDGERCFEDIQEEAERAGVSIRTIRTAKAKLKCTTHRKKGSKGKMTYYWRLPE